MARTGAERQPDADLGHAAPDRVGHHPVDAAKTAAPAAKPKTAASGFTSCNRGSSMGEYASATLMPYQASSRPAAPPATATSTPSALLGHLDDDLSKGRLARPAIDLDAVFRRAAELSQRRAAQTLARTLDILHVAASMALACTTLVSADERQIALATSEGLSVVDIRESTETAPR